jgi:hypothetical protein
LSTLTPEGKGEEVVERVGGADEKLLGNMFLLHLSCICNAYNRHSEAGRPPEGGTPNENSKQL